MKPLQQLEFQKFANLLDLPVPLAQAYLAGVLETRKAINYKRGFIVIHTPGKLPKLLHRVWGGTLFWHVQGNSRSRVFRSNRKGTRQILEGIWPYLFFERKRVRRFLKKNHL